MTERRVAVTGMDIGQAIAAIFGLQSTRRITIDIGLDDAVKVRVEFYPTAEEMAQVQTLMEEYRLIRAVVTEPATIADRYEYGLRLLEERGLPIRHVLARIKLWGELPSEEGLLLKSDR